MKNRLALMTILALALGACSGKQHLTAPDSVVQQEETAGGFGSGHDGTSGDGVMIGSGHSTGTETPSPSDAERGGVTIGSGH